MHNYAEIAPRIAAHKEKHPAAKANDIQKALGISDFVYNRALNRTPARTPQRKVVRRKTQPITYQKIADVLNIPSEVVTAFVIKGAPSEVARVLSELRQ